MKLFLALTFASALLASGCDHPFKTSACQVDTDCPMRDGGKAVCYNYRCVECHYDADCGDGRVCGGNQTCESLDSRPKEKADKADLDGAKIGPPKDLEECARRCKGEAACGADCRARFKK